MQEKPHLQSERLNDTLARFYHWVQQCNSHGVLPELSRRMDTKKHSEKTLESSHAG